jgi:hypothetical protein
MPWSGPIMGMKPTGISARSKKPGSRNATHQRARLRLFQYNEYPIRPADPRIGDWLNTVGCLAGSQIGIHPVDPDGRRAADIAGRYNEREINSFMISLVPP